jgi:predicted type IV restriction endonuclease
VRLEFIDPFLDALGWDMDNKPGYAYNYKEVIFEDAIKVDGTTKTPDSAF